MAAKLFAILVCLFTGISAGTAAPVPKTQIPALEVTLTGDLQILTITIKNNTDETVDVPYQVSPLEKFVFNFEGDKGKSTRLPRKESDPEDPNPGTLKIPAKKSAKLTMHICHLMPELNNPGSVKIMAEWHFDGKILKAEPVTFK